MSQANLAVAEIMGGEFQERSLEAQERWSDVSSLDVQQSMQDITTVDLGERSVGVVVIEPETADFDEETTLTLELPHKNGWSPQHSVRAKILQQTVAPDSRLIVFPDNSFGSRLNYYTAGDKKRMMSGDSLPIAEAQMAALEALAPSLGLTGILSTGYSKGGRPALGLAVVGSDVVEVKKANADEMPSKTDRGLVRLGLDFMTSGTDVSSAAKAANIPALSAIMSSSELNMDFIKFALANLDPRSLSDIRSMTGSADHLVAEAVRQLGGENVKIGHVEGSKLFDPDSLSEESRSMARVERYTGSELFGHASGDNSILHAAMAYRGLRA